MSVGDQKDTELPDLAPDPWIRFDMWAERARGHAEAAVATATPEGSDDSEPTPASKAHGWAADVFRDLATSCVPKQAIRRDRP